MKRKILIGGIAAVTLLTASTASAFAAKSPAPAPAQVTKASPGKANGVTAHAAPAKVVPVTGGGKTGPAPVVLTPVPFKAGVVKGGIATAVPRTGVKLTETVPALKTLPAK